MHTLTFICRRKHRGTASSRRRGLWPLLRRLNPGVKDRVLEEEDLHAGLNLAAPVEIMVGLGKGLEKSRRSNWLKSDLVEERYAIRPMKTVADLKASSTVALRGGYGAGYGAVMGPLSRPRNRQPG